ncbi:hypothetical protein EZS27_030214 [termite gut metagenome]|uniref:Uncharacterized protein n=1 Tax=termite gut metagenome TaxID=433724 RepID=A0A5J4QE26_9ZZZZ
MINNVLTLHNHKPLKPKRDNSENIKQIILKINKSDKTKMGIKTGMILYRSDVNM